ncbi:MAG: alpha/beta fold hydrolase [Planctomycetota bacterium]
MTAAVHLMLLPGMDGTGRLFEPLRRSVEADARFTAQVVVYPPGDRLDYTALLERVLAEWPADGSRVVIVAESFSGPIGVRLAARAMPGLAALVLVASFVRSPIRWLPAWLAGLTGRVAFALPPPAWALRHWLTGHDADRELVAATRAAVRTVSPSVMAYRAACALRTNVAAELRACPVPVLDLRGSRDRVVPARCRRVVLQARPDATTVSLDAPHFVLQRRPLAALDAIHTFATGTRA